MILFDVSGTLFAALHVDISSGEKPNLEYIRHLVLNSLRSHNKRFRDEYGQMVICCDSNSWRNKEFEYYKWVRRQERNDDNNEWGQIFQFMSEIMDDIKDHFPFPVIKTRGAEADDIIGVLTKNSKEPVLIISNDKDCVSLTSENVKQYRPYMKDFYEVDSPARYEFELIVSGDKSDGIPSILEDEDFLKTQWEVKKSGEKPPRAKPVSAKFKENAWEQYKLGETALSVLIGKDKMKRFKMNQKLISFDHIPNDITDAILKDYLEAASSVGNIMKAMTYMTSRRMQLLAKEIKDFEINKTPRAKMSMF